MKSFQKLKRLYYHIPRSVPINLFESILSPSSQDADTRFQHVGEEGLTKIESS